MNFSNFLNACGEYPDNVIPLNISGKTKRGYITINLPKLERYVNKWLKQRNIVNSIEFEIKNNKLNMYLTMETNKTLSTNIGYVLFGYDVRNAWNEVRIPFNMYFYQPHTTVNDYYGMKKHHFRDKENLFPAFYESNHIEISESIASIIADTKFLYEKNGALKGEKKYE